jgi:hypothetical protein
MKDKQTGAEGKVVSNQTEIWSIPLVALFILQEVSLNHPDYVRITGRNIPDVGHLSEFHDLKCQTAFPRSVSLLFSGNSLVSQYQEKRNRWDIDSYEFGRDLRNLKDASEFDDCQKQKGLLLGHRKIRIAFCQIDQMETLRNSKAFVKCTEWDITKKPNKQIDDRRLQQCPCLSRFS